MNAFVEKGGYNMLEYVWNLRSFTKLFRATSKEWFWKYWYGVVEVKENVVKGGNGRE